MFDRCKCAFKVFSLEQVHIVYCILYMVHNQILLLSLIQYLPFQ